MTRVVAAIVTHDRRELVLECLAAVYAQTRAPDEVVVIDNASTDGTANAIRIRFPSVAVRALTRNTGGAGGFAIGLSAALRLGADAVWLMDDDTVPQPGALAALLATRRAYGAPGPAVVASRVLWTDGHTHAMNTPRPKPFASRAERRAAEAIGAVAIRSASFVSVLLDARTCRERGLPVADYFLWNDDFEYVARLLRGNIGLLCPTSVAVHKTSAPGRSDTDPGVRFYYEVRNKVWLFTRSPALSPVEKLLYGGATLRRWAAVIIWSGNGRMLLRCLLRGMVAGLRRGPRSNERVLLDIYEPPPTRVRAG